MGNGPGVQSRSARHVSGSCVIAIVLGCLLVQPVAAQNSSPPSAAELAEYRRTCAAEIAGFEAAAQATSGGHADPGVVQRKIDEDYLIAVSGGPGNPRYTAEEIRSHDAGMAAQLQRNLANVSAQQRPWFVAYQALYVCAARVGIRYASGSGRVPSPSQPAAARPSTPAAPPPAAPRPAQSYDLSGEWVGESSGNRVRQTMVRGGFTGVAIGGPGASAGTQFYREVSPGLYVLDFPGGGQARVQMLGPDRYRVTVSDGWTDVFRRVGGVAPVGSAAAAPENAARRAAVDAINARNYAEAARLLEPLAQAGAPDAQTFLGSLLYNGLGVPQDQPRGLAMVRLAAAQNYPGAITWLAEREAQRRALAATGVPAGRGTETADPAANMIPEVAAAWRAATDPAVRARIARNAAAYAASRPSLVVRANSGTGCIRPEMINYRFEPPVNGASEVWLADIRLTNSCNSEQFAYAEERMTNGGNVGMPITNVGRFPGRWDRRRDPAVGFRPWNPEGESPRYRLRAGAEWSGGGIYHGGSSNQVELWIGSCPSHGPGNVTQIGFRPTAYMREDPRVACVPGVQGPDGY